MKLSGFILTKNNEGTIRYALESICKYMDELIVVDSGSEDKTLDIVSRYTDKIFFNEMKNFSNQKKFAAGKCTGDWIFMLDADELVGKNFPKVLKLINGVSDKFRTVALARYNLVKIDPLVHITTKPHYQDWQIRFIKNNERILYDDQAIHTKIMNYKPRLKCGFGHIFHLDFLVKNYDMRKNKVEFYETKQLGAGYPRMYLFEDYPYRTIKTVEKLDDYIYKMLLENKSFLSHQEHSNSLLQNYHELKYKCHAFLTYAKALIKPK